MENKRKKHEKKMEKLLKQIVKEESKKKQNALTSGSVSASDFENDKAPAVKPAPQKTAEFDVKQKIAAVSGEQEKNKKKKWKKQTERISVLRLFAYFVLAMLLVTMIYYYFTKNAENSFFIFSGAILLFSAYLVMRKRMQRYYEIKKMEDIFPDFISLMSSNLRAGMTIDQALVLSARKEFEPLDKEILQVGKDIMTAREISEALFDMGERIGSDEIKKTIQLLISGIRSGGNLSVLLEQTSNNMRERGFVKKRAASNVLMYIIFIFFAVAVGAPLLFALSSILVQIMSAMFSEMPVTETNMNLPFTIGKINVSVNFIIYFSVAFIIAGAILASLILGLVGKGNEKDGLKYAIPLIVLGLAVFFASRLFLAKYFVNMFG